MRLRPQSKCEPCGQSSCERRRVYLSNRGGGEEGGEAASAVASLLILLPEGGVHEFAVPAAVDKWALGAVELLETIISLR